MADEAEEVQAVEEAVEPIFAGDGGEGIPDEAVAADGAEAEFEEAEPIADQADDDDYEQPAVADDDVEPVEGAEVGDADEEQPIQEPVEAAAERDAQAEAVVAAADGEHQAEEQGVEAIEVDEQPAEDEEPKEEQTEGKDGDDDMNQESEQAPHEDMAGPPDDNDEEQQDQKPQNGVNQEGSDAQLPENDPMSLPPHGTEIFIGNIGHACTKDDIKEFCEKIAPVHKIHIPPPKSEGANNPGYAFVMYKNRVAAAEAIEQMGGNTMPAAPARKLTVKYSSKQKYKVYVCNIPRNKGRQELLESFRGLVRGIEELDITTQKDQGRPGQNRGFCFLEMYNQAVAEEGMATLSAPGVQLCGIVITPPLRVEWADTKGEGSCNSEVKSLHITNLPEDTTEDSLREAFSKYGPLERIALLDRKNDRGGEPGKRREYAFVHYEKRSVMLQAYEGIQKQPITLSGEDLIVSIAKPAANQRDSDRGMGGDRMGGRMGPMHGRNGPVGGRGGYNEFDNGGYNQGYGRGGPMGGRGMGPRDRMERDRMEGGFDRSDRRSGSWGGSGGMRDRERGGGGGWGGPMDGGYNRGGGVVGYDRRSPNGWGGDDYGGYGGGPPGGFDGGYNDGGGGGYGGGPPRMGGGGGDWGEPPGQQMMPMPFMMMQAGGMGQMGGAGGGAAPRMGMGGGGYDAGAKPSTGGYGAARTGGGNVVHGATTTRGYGNNNGAPGYGGSAPGGPGGYGAPMGGYGGGRQMGQNAAGRSGGYGGGMRYGY